MKTILLVAIFLISVAGFGQTANHKILYHKDSLPSWNDFLAPAPESNEYAALTCSGIEIETVVEDDLYVVNQGAYFYKYKSWAKEAHLSVNIYEHELLHFQITELYARLLRKKIISISATQRG